jgi:RHS repeat-associated protein
VTACRSRPAYGRTIATWSGTGGSTSVGEKSWKDQGRLDVSPTGLASPTPLYDMSARYYSPGLGAFTSIDSVMGAAQNPLSLNRYLYALANPATLQDPSGYYACSVGRRCNAGGHVVVAKGHSAATSPSNTPTSGKDADDTSGSPKSKPTEPVGDYGLCQYESCDRDGMPPIVAWPEGRFRLCALTSRSCITDSQRKRIAGG